MTRVFYDSTFSATPDPKAFAKPGLRTLFLVPRPTFLSGLGSVMDLFGVPRRYNYSRTDDEADARALRCDWLATGDDLWWAVRHFGPPTKRVRKEPLPDPADSTAEDLVAARG
jgi:hypothetical protein